MCCVSDVQGEAVGCRVELCAARDVTEGKSFCDKPRASESHLKGSQF